MGAQAEAGDARAGRRALVFAALGDETRLALIGRLCAGERRSIHELTEFAGGRAGAGRLTRQAVTKHLRVLERAGVVRCVRAGRERLFQLEPGPLGEMREYLDWVGASWDDALGRLRERVELDAAGEDVEEEQTGWGGL